MGFLKANAPKRGDETVDARFAPILEPNLWGDNIFEAGRTFSDKYQLDAMGQVFVRKLGKGAVDRTADMGFVHTQTEDELIAITLDEKFKRSEQIFEAVEVARTSGTGMQKMEEVGRVVGEEWQEVAHAKLLDGATALTDTTATASADTREMVIAARKAARDNKAKPNTIIMSTNFYAKLLEESTAGQWFTPASNDEKLRTGVLGRVYGMDVYESNFLEDDGTAGSTEFVMYEYEAYSILTQLIASRIVDASPNWTGSAAQVEIISGFKVTNPDRVYKKVVA